MSWESSLEAISITKFNFKVNTHKPSLVLARIGSAFVNVHLAFISCESVPAYTIKPIDLVNTSCIVLTVYIDTFINVVLTISSIKSCRADAPVCSSSIHTFAFVLTRVWCTVIDVLFAIVSLVACDIIHDVNISLHRYIILLTLSYLLHRGRCSCLFHPYKLLHLDTVITRIRLRLFRTTFRWTPIGTDSCILLDNCCTKHYWNKGMSCTHQHHLHN